MSLDIVIHDTPHPIGYTSDSKFDWKFVWHTTETDGMPGYEDGAIAPQLTAQLREYGSTTKIQRRLHIHYDFKTHAGKALKHTSGSGETNTDHAVQCEIISTCDPKSKSGALFVGDFTDDDYDFLGEVKLYVRKYVPIANLALGRFIAYPQSYGPSNGVRLSVSRWDNATGHCGHMHVPGNVHGDPGLFNINKVLSYVPPTPVVKDDDMQYLAQFASPHPQTPAMYVSNGSTRRGVISPFVRDQLISSGVDAHIHTFTATNEMNSFAGPLDPESLEYDPVTKKWGPQAPS